MDPKDPTKTKIFIPMRMTLRGLKDRDAHNLETFTGKSTRISHRRVVYEAAIHGWPLAAVDARKAFLKGVRYSLIAKLIGEPLRIVYVDSGTTAAAVRRTLPGYEDIDQACEALLARKPVTGCKNTPRTWSTCLADATNHKFGAKPQLHNGQLVTRHYAVTGEHKCLATKHVDDIKVAAPPHTLDEFITTLHQARGDGGLNSLVIHSPIAMVDTWEPQPVTRWIRQNIYGLPNRSLSPMPAPGRQRCQRHQNYRPVSYRF